MPRLQSTNYSRHERPAMGRPTSKLSVVWCVVMSPLILAIVASSGCGPRTDRLAVSGNVTLDGAPLDSGSIRFTSVEREKLLVTGAMIQDGVYQISPEKGLRPGAYHLEIYAPDHNAPPIMARQSRGGPGLPVAPERIPPEYNVDSKQTIEVTPDGENHFVFDITSKPAR